jgi:hypothetical protein
VVEVIQEFAVKKTAKKGSFVKSRLEVLDSLMGCDLENICVKAERRTSEKSVNEN